MRLLTLYVRSRQVPAAAATALVTITALCFLGAAVTIPQLSILVVVLAAGIGASLLGPGLGAANPELERTGAISWPTWRAAHILLGAAVIGALLAAGSLLDDSFPSLAIIARAVAGLSGLVALGAATIGASRSWMLPIAWAGYTVVAGSAATGAWYEQVPGWLLQPPGTASATATAVTLFAAGALVYVAKGSRR